MSTALLASEPRPGSIKALLPFLAITFGLAWGLVALLVIFPAQLTRVFGDVSGTNPLFVLAVYAPALAGFTIVVFQGGVAGLRRYLSRLSLWRCPPAWYAFLLLGIPFLFFSGAWLKGGLSEQPMASFNWPGMMVAMAITMIIGPVEEFGWRGVALPLLQRRFAPIWAGLILGVIWGLWHLPAFLLSGTPQSAWSFAPFFIGSVAISLIVTPLFNASSGSILLPALVHFQLNNPLFPDAQPHDTVLFVVAAIIVVWLNRKAMFDRSAAVTAFIPGTESSAQGVVSSDRTGGIGDAALEARLPGP